MTRKIKVLHIGFDDNPGGIESVIYSWLKNKPEDFQFDFTNNKTNPLAYEDDLRARGCNIYKIPPMYENYIGNYKAIKKIVDEGDYDYIHHHLMTFIEPSPTLIANRRKKTKSICHCHSNYKELPFGEHVLSVYTKIRLFGRKYLRLSCSIEGGVSMFGNKDFTIIENGIKSDRFIFSLEKREKIRKQYGIDDNDFVVGHIGRQSPDKNYELLLDSFVEFHNKVSNSKLMLVGDISCDSNEILESLKQLGIDDITIKPGVVSNTPDFYSAMDAFIFPSIKEGLGIVLIEAQASGLPCVASTNIPRDAKVTDNVEFVELDKNSMCDALIRAKGKIIDRASVRIEDRYDIANSSKKMFDFYRKHLND